MRIPSLTRNQRRQATDDNLIPLINIVFLILIFFLVAGRISAHDSVLFSAPKSVQENQLEEEDITILLDADGGIWLNSQPVDNDLQTRLGTLSINADTVVVLKVDAGLNAPVLDPVLSALQSLGIQRLKLVTIASAS